VQVQRFFVGGPEVAGVAGEGLELLVDGGDVALHGGLGERGEVAQLALEPALVLVNRPGVNVRIVAITFAIIFWRFYLKCGNLPMHKKFQYCFFKSVKS
jgi:hypothetical protein